MLLTTIYRRIRYRLDDPLRDQYVPKRDRLDADDDEWASSPEISAAEDVAIGQEATGDVVAEKDLI